ncbi:LexA/Signal peptidase [Calocera viscosa TUFC12733]|uniref:Mitochondrial inner membrane protease subunit n=1 Tax=Calocera viscosa (strain TUFC12733) TaxID=1330018 RepID=A0A167Q0E9_CALVF|nr:LexA/Signal peptidase [Calocera viscosa TUFC12733]
MSWLRRFLPSRPLRSRLPLWTHRYVPSRPPTTRKLVHYSKRAVQFLGFLWLFEEWGADVRLAWGASMLPTLRHDTSIVLVSKYPPAFRPPNLKVGDLVVAQSPLKQHWQVLKRVVGLPGDTICVDPSGAVRGHGGWEDGGGGREHVVVPRGHVWLAGDNMSASIDSRTFGPISLALLKGKVFYRIWPDPGPLENTLRELDTGDEDI